MPNRFWLTSNAKQRKLFAGLSASSLHRALGPLAWLVSFVMLAVLGMLLTGCASNPSVGCEPQPQVSLPALPMELPKVSYSLSLENKLQKLRHLLMSGRTTPEQ